MLAALGHGLDVIEFLSKERRQVPLGAVAAAVWSEHYGALRHLLSRKRRDLAFLGRAVAAPVDPQHGDLASYLFFCREFAEELLAMGAANAKAWLERSHDDGPWYWGAKLD